MATFEEHIEGLTQIDITASSAPTINELTEMLREALIYTVNKIIEFRPQEIPKFTKTTNATSFVLKKGAILSVLREHDDTDILRMCTPISPSLRYEATDVESLHYRSKYNPGYYELNGYVHCVPQAASGNNDIVVTQVHYDTGLVATDNYNSTAIENFPLDYEYLVALYAAALTSNAAASDIQNNMPEKPLAPSLPEFPSVPVINLVADFISDGVSLPTLPQYNPPALEFDLSKALLALNNEDVEMAEKELELLDKRVERFKTLKENNVQTYTKELEIFKADLENLGKNADRDIQAKVAEHKGTLEEYSANIMKYEKESATILGELSQKINIFQNEVAQYERELQEKMTKYKWYYENYINFMNQYNNSIMGAPKAPQQQENEGE